MRFTLMKATYDFFADLDRLRLPSTPRVPTAPPATVLPLTPKPIPKKITGEFVNDRRGIRGVLPGGHPPAHEQSDVAAPGARQANDPNGLLPQRENAGY